MKTDREPRLYLVTSAEGQAVVMDGPEARRRVKESLCASPELMRDDRDDGSFTIMRNWMDPVTYEPVSSPRGDETPAAPRYEELVPSDDRKWTKLGIIDRAHVRRTVGNALRRQCRKITLANGTIVLLRGRFQVQRFIPTTKVSE